MTASRPSILQPYYDYAELMEERQQVRVPEPTPAVVRPAVTPHPLFSQRAAWWDLLIAVGRLLTGRLR